MSDEQALLAAIWAQPHEDTPRLVYADWLDENGQADRAEFIRVQIEAANLRWNDPRWKELAERAKQLLEAHGEEWIEPFRWLSPGGQTTIHTSEPTIDGWGGGVELGWVDPHPGDFGDSAPPYQRFIDFHRGFPRKIWLEPTALLAVPETQSTPGPRPQLGLTWIPHTREPGWVEAIWPAVRHALQPSRFSDWVFATSYYHQYDWLRLLVTDPDVARGVSGLHLEVTGGAEVPPDAAITNLYPLTPNLDTLAFFDGEWSPAVIRELGPAGLSRRLRHLVYRDNTGEHSAADALRVMAEIGAWPQLVGLTLMGLEGVGPETVNDFRPGMLPALKRLMFHARADTPRRPVAAFLHDLLAHPPLAHVEMIQYIPWPGNRDSTLTALKKRCGGRFVYGYGKAADE